MSGYLVGVSRLHFLAPFPVFKMSKFPCRAVFMRVSVTSVFFILFEDSYSRAVAEEDQTFSDLELLM